MDKTDSSFDAQIEERINEAVRSAHRSLAPTMAEEVSDAREKVGEERGEGLIAEGSASMDSRLTVLIKGLAEESEKIDQDVESLQQELARLLVQKRDAQVCLSTMEWLVTHIFSGDAVREQVKGALAQDPTGIYSQMMVRAAKFLDMDGGGSPDHDGYDWHPSKFRTMQGVGTLSDPVEIDVHYCPVCDLGFRDADDLARHVKSKCKYKKEEAYYKKWREENPEAAGGDRISLRIAGRLCDVCGYVAKSKGGLATHMRKHKKDSEKKGRA